MTTPALFTLGTRGSPLALTQANEARHRSAAAHGWEIETIALQVIRTTGDRIQDRPLADVGGKGLFTKEIDAALLAGAIDAAVHSAKDRPRTCLDHASRRSNRPLSAARGRALRSYLRVGRHNRGSPMRRHSALRRFAAKPRRFACARISSPYSCAATSRRGSARRRRAKSGPRCSRSPA
jgi:hydroxymethylbilane synthase